jgi:hypothetical protein
VAKKSAVQSDTYSNIGGRGRSQERMRMKTRKPREDVSEDKKAKKVDSAGAAIVGEDTDSCIFERTRAQTFVNYELGGGLHQA